MSSVTDTPAAQRREIHYPDSDGQPMADNTRHFSWIVLIKENLEAMFREREDVFVAGDLLWYPVEGRPDIRRAPDAMVVFGRPKGYRGSYKQWEEDGLAPQVVFEVQSPLNGFKEMLEKLEFYEAYGVEEYYTYEPDPERNDLTGFQRQGERLRPIDEMNGWVSPRLGIRFDMSGEELRIFRPDNEPFRSHQELWKIVEQARREQEAMHASHQHINQQVIWMEAKLRELGVEPEGLEGGGAVEAEDDKQ
jgi:Uma2 family endonuclease